jgi:phosphatidylinositol alpha-1,6-mannosyltransferase
MNSKKILLVSPDFPPPFVGGSLVWIHSLISNSKYNYEVLTAENKFTHSNINISTIKSKFITNSSNPTRLNLFFNYFYIFFWCLINLKKNKYDLVVSNPGLVGNCIVFFLCKILRIKVIGTVYSEEITTSIYGKNLKSKFKLFLVKFFYKYADIFITVCSFSENLIKSFKFNKNIYVLPPGDLLKIENKNFNYPSTLLSVGRLIKRKGFDRLIIATNEAKKKIPNLKLNIIGNGDEFQNLNKLIKNLNACEFIKIYSNVNREQLNKFYLQSDLFILANYMMENGDTEGCPVVLIEAMSYLLPVIGGKGGGVDTAISDGKNGYIIDSNQITEVANKIILILNDINLIKQMSLYSKKKIISEHNIKVISQKFDNIVFDLSNT